jgi:hypothetical protein
MVFINGWELMSLIDKLSGLVGARDDDEKDDGYPKGEIGCWVCNGTGDICLECDEPGNYCECKIPRWLPCSVCKGKGSVVDEADAEASIDYQHPDALPAVDAAEDAGLSAVHKLEEETKS